MKLTALKGEQPAHCLALEEAWLEAAEGGGDEQLLFWESPIPAIVVGYGQSVDREVNRPACEADGVALLRRCSGGGTVAQGPGCLSYALILHQQRDPALQTIAGANGWIMERQRRALAHVLGREVLVYGTTDLVTAGRKFSGNAQRRRREALLFHGTFLLHFDVPSLSRWLRFPSLQPEYRAGRPHEDFVANLEVPADRVMEALAHEWGARPAPQELPLERLGALLQERYANPEWILRR